MTAFTTLIDSRWQAVDAETPLFRALIELSPQAQRAINLRFWEKYTIEEIATQLSMTWEQVDQLIEETLLELRERLSYAGALSFYLEAS